ncbi:MAG: Chromosomal replication initiator protein DnaA [Chlamydiia bacterium]|nr:Chromosomal replication initiator protein DnaA [Chlamydiia bacterium]MCH9618150.1 Chromosomal replication initiator protein DnaA [Chlamydiia bacterium]MCH9624030.1 Chromosomal replication initiator protein DnaA [Chlamydiia bacterium]
MEAWEKFIDFLETKYGKATTDKWARTLKVLRFDACNIFLKSNDFFQTQWVGEYILPLAKEHFLDTNGKFIRIHIDAEEKKEKAKIPTKEVAIKFCSDIASPGATLDSYYASSENAFTHKALGKIFGYDTELGSMSSLPEDPPNPVYVYGPKGSGKTHLLMSIKGVLESHGLNVFYVNADTFTDHVVHAIRFGKMQTFRKTYRNIDALIIDDIEVLSRKNATQEEFFHTFNTLQTTGRMIVLSSTFSPRKLEGIEERLVSRFEWGILLNIETTKDRAINERLLNEKLNFLSLIVDDQTREYLLDNFTAAHQLSAAIESLSKASISDTVALNGAKPILDRLIKQRIIDGLNSNKILEEIAKIFGIRVIDMQSKAQTRDCVLPRQFAMFFLRHELKMPFMKIGFIFKKDHSTVMTSIKLIENLAEKNHEETIYYINAIGAALTKVRNGIETAKV